LYILTSSRTFSAPEALAYDMQALKRATLVGETTHGGANPTTIFRITDYFSASIPFGSSISAVTKTDTEGAGVKPDVAVPADQALLTAHLMALKKALKRYGGDREYADSLRRTIAEKEKELAALKAKP
jgi:C-terminal processing protease CtpA/Prc